LSIKKASRLGGFSYSLAAAAVVITATAVIGYIAAIAATVAEQQDENDNPAPVATTETVIIAHNTYLRKITCGICRSFQVIPQRKKCYNQKNKKMTSPDLASLGHPPQRGGLSSPLGSRVRALPEAEKARAPQTEGGICKAQANDG